MKQSIKYFSILILFLIILDFLNGIETHNLHNTFKKNKKIFTLQNIHQAEFIKKDFLVYNYHRKKIKFINFQNLVPGLYFIKSKSSKVYLFWRSK